MKRKSNFSRRDFLQTSAIAASALAVPYFVRASALGKEGRPAPSDRIVMAAIGTGGKGMGDMNELARLSETQFVAVCDVDSKHAANAKGAIDKHYKNKDCKVTGDFREIMANKDIDAVSISTPDHWHALIAIAAAKAKKDIYCQKPLANSVAESRAVVDAVRANKVILQVGSQERSGKDGRFGCELVRNGRIGPLRTIEIYLPMEEKHHIAAKNTAAHPKEEKVPKELDYDMWLGHTPKDYYTSERLPFKWRFNFNYGSGEMGDRGAHVIDIARLGGGLDDMQPVTINSRGERNADSLYNIFWKFNFKNMYPNGIKMVGVSDRPKGEPAIKAPRGIKFVGDDGWLFIEIHGGKLTASNPELLKETIGESEIDLGRSPGHYRNFIECVKSRHDPIATVEHGHGTAVACHLNNIGAILGRDLKWDGAAEKFVNDDEANKLLLPSMRSPWTL